MVVGFVVVVAAVVAVVVGQLLQRPLHLFRKNDHTAMLHRNFRWGRHSCGSSGTPWQFGTDVPVFVVVVAVVVVVHFPHSTGQVSCNARAYSWTACCLPSAMQSCAEAPLHSSGSAAPAQYSVVVVITVMADVAVVVVVVTVVAVFVVVVMDVSVTVVFVVLVVSHRPHRALQSSRKRLPSPPGTAHKKPLVGVHSCEWSATPWQFATVVVVAVVVVVPVVVVVDVAVVVVVDVDVTVVVVAVVVVDVVVVVVDVVVVVVDVVVLTVVVVVVVVVVVHVLQRTEHCVCSSIASSSSSPDLLATSQS